jgi:hypothetical protein
MPDPTYGLPNGGNVNLGAWNQLQAMYPYVTFGPQMAQQLANLQFGAGLDAQNQNNSMAYQLAQGAASNRLADNVGSQLALQGLGQSPQAFSAFGPGNWGVHQVQPPNILDIYNQMNSGLGGIFGTAQSLPGGSGGVGTGPLSPISGGFGSPATSPTVGTPWSQPPQPVIGQPWSSPPTSGWANDTPSTFGPKQGANGMVPWEGGGSNTTSMWNPQTGAFQMGQFGSMPAGQKMGATQPRSPMAQPMQPRQGTPGSAFAGVQQLAGFGTPRGYGLAPAMQSDSALGITPFGSPRTNVADYYKMNAGQREAQDYMQSLFGWSPQMMAQERATFTPGARLYS